MNTHVSSLLHPSTTICFGRPYQIKLHQDPNVPLLLAGVVLVRFFNIEVDRLPSMLLALQKEGVVMCGFYNKEIAEAKVDMVNQFAKSSQNTLTCSMDHLDLFE